MPDPKFDRRIKLVEESIDQYGVYLLNYCRELCLPQGLDFEVLYEDLWIYVLNKFPEDKIKHVGFLRFKAYQSFIDEWRRAKRNPVAAVEVVPDTPLETNQEEEPSNENEATIMERFFEEHPVEQTDTQKRVLFLWARYGKTAAEISAELNIPRSTVSDWVRLGRDAVIEYVESQSYRKS